MARKVKILGIDPNCCDVVRENTGLVNDAILSFYEGRIAKIDRHLEKNKVSYKALLSSFVDDNFSYLLQFMISDLLDGEVLSCSLFDSNVVSWFEDLVKRFAGFSSEVIGFLGAIYNNAECYRAYGNKVVIITEEDKSNFNKMLDSYIKWRCEKDFELNGKVFDTLVQTHDEFRILTVEERYALNEELESEFFCSVDKTEDLYYELCVKLAGISHAFYKSIHFYKLKNSYLWMEHSIKLLLQIRKLEEKKRYYSDILERIKDRPNEAISLFARDSYSWGAMRQLKYWVRYGKSFEREHSRETVNLLMIKPGTKVYNNDDLLSFIDKRNKDFSKRVTKDSRVILATIPDSLEYESILNVIEYAFNGGERLTVIFVCGSSRVSDIVKSEIAKKIFRDIKKRDLKVGWSSECFFRNRSYFVCVDQNYYDDFFRNCPCNYNLFRYYNSGFTAKDRGNSLYNVTKVMKIYFEKSPEQFKMVSEGVLSGDWDRAFNFFSLFQEKMKSLSVEVIDGRELPLDSDLVISHICSCGGIFGDWIDRLPYIDKSSLESYMRSSGYEKRKNEVRLYIISLKTIFPKKWEEILLSELDYSAVIRYHVDDPIFLEDAICVFKKIFKKKWWKNIYRIEEFSYLVADYQKNSELFDYILRVFKQMFPKTWKDDITDVNLYQKVVSVLQSGVKSASEIKRLCLTKSSAGDEGMRDEDGGLIF